MTQIEDTIPERPGDEAQRRNRKVRRLLPAVVVGALSLVAAIYLSLRDRVVELTFTEDQLLAQFEKLLPWTERYLFIFEVTLDNPRIDLIDGDNRISGGVDVTLNVYLSDQPAPLGGAVDISGGVRYEPETGSFYLTDPHVENVRIAGVPDRYANRANEAISFALEDFYKARPIYVLSPHDARTSAARLVLKDVYVEDEKLFLKMSLAPTARSGS
jgi:hypothetical protein